MEVGQVDNRMSFDPKTLPVEFREYPEDFRFEGVELGEKFGLLAVPWREGGESGLMWIPAVRDGNSLFDNLSKIGERAGDYFWKEKELGELERKRIKFALEKLKLPILLAVHAGMNREDLWREGKAEIGGDIKVPGEEVETPVVLGVVGPARVGKSLLAAGLTIRDDMELLSLTPPEMGAEGYLKCFNKKMGGEEMVGMVSKMREGRVEKDKKEIVRDKMSVRQRMNEILDKVLFSGERPEFYVTDSRASGFRSSVLPEDVVLPLDSYHVTIMESAEALVYINSEDAGGYGDSVHIWENDMNRVRAELMLLFGLGYLMSNLQGDNSLRITGEALDGMMKLINRCKGRVTERGKELRDAFLGSLG